MPAAPLPGEVAGRVAPLTGEEPAELELVEAAGRSPQVLRAVALLTGDGPVRGGLVDPSRPALQAVQRAVGWTVGGYDTRPGPEAAARKQKDRLEILLKYRQPAPVEGALPRVAMLDYLSDSLFGVPMRSVSSDLEVPQFVDLAGEVVTPQWVEADWENFDRTAAPARVFAPNRYSYSLPEAPGAGAHPLQARAQHWLLWYLHQPPDPLCDPTDKRIDAELREELVRVAGEAGFGRVDYIWYRNPAMSVPDMFHVQVFWIVPS